MTRLEAQTATESPTAGRRPGRTVTMAIGEDLEHDTVSDFLADVDQAFASAAGELGLLVVDCSRLEFCDSSGLSALLMTQRRVQAQGGRMVLGEQPAVLRALLQLTGTSVVFEDSPVQARAPRTGRDEPAWEPLTPPGQLAASLVRVDGEEEDEDAGEHEDDGEEEYEDTEDIDERTASMNSCANVSQVDGYQVVALSGAIDIECADDVRLVLDAAVADAVADCASTPPPTSVPTPSSAPTSSPAPDSAAAARGRPRVIVDVSDLEFADSTTLHLLIQAQKHAEVVLAGPLSSGVRLLLKVAGVMSLFPRYPSVEAAVEAEKGEPAWKPGR